MCDREKTRESFSGDHRYARAVTEKEKTFEMLRKECADGLTEERKRNPTDPKLAATKVPTLESELAIVCAKK